uniref:C2 domain-containing protein n=1 Tax=Kalanchoe fedtschenkoi TaxID=63787 RepID=A0A7N1A979_KALFE
MGCGFSDIKGGQQAVGGTPARPGDTAADPGPNEAVVLFNKLRGYGSLFTSMESDPMTVVYLKKKDGALEEIGRTEVIMNNLEPAWIQKININFQFEIAQPLVFQVYDVDTKYHNVPVKSINLKDQDFLGEANCNLSEIVTKQSQSLTLNLYSDKGHGVKTAGSLTVHAEETASSRTVVELIFRCSNLENKDFFSKSDPFLKISRIVEAGGCVPVCKTEVVTNNLNPTWKPISLGMQHFGSKENPLIIECFDFNSNGDHVLIGKVQTSLLEVERLHKETSGIHFVRPSSDPRDHDKVLKGELFVNQYVEKHVDSFVDYISSGFELNFMVAVDFTGSNGNPRSPTSLHYVDPSGRLNAYQQAITEVGDVIQFYNADKYFPSWGFGGRLPSGVVSHCYMHCVKSKLNN